MPHKEGECCDPPAGTIIGQWSLYCAELEHRVTARKAWPKALKRRSAVSVGLFNDMRAWTVWAAPELGIVFSIAACECPHNDSLYLKVGKRFRKKRFVVGRGRDPSDATDDSDKRLFRKEMSPLDEQLKLRHVKSGRYLSCDKRGNLTLRKKMERADSWTISEHFGPDTNSL